MPTAASRPFSFFVRARCAFIACLACSRECNACAAGSSRRNSGEAAVAAIESWRTMGSGGQWWAGRRDAPWLIRRRAARARSQSALRLFEAFASAVDSDRNDDEILIVIVGVVVVGQLVEPARLPELRGRQDGEVSLEQQVWRGFQRHTQRGARRSIVAASRQLDQSAAAKSKPVAALRRTIAKPVSRRRGSRFSPAGTRTISQPSSVGNLFGNTSLRRAAEYLRFSSRRDEAAGLMRHLREKCRLAFGRRNREARAGAGERLHPAGRIRQKRKKPPKRLFGRGP